MIKKIIRLVIVLFFPFALTAQVTTGSINGSVKDSKGGELPGATIEVLHVPSGSVSRATSGKNGIFNIPNLRVGGPYNVTITYVGLNRK